MSRAGAVRQSANSPQQSLKHVPASQSARTDAHVHTHAAAANNSFKSLPRDPASVSTQSPPLRLNSLERLPKWLVCIPLTLQWLGLSLRYGSLTLPTAANPHITAGGLVGEGKLEYFAGMGPVALDAVAPYCGVTTRFQATDPALQQELQRAGLRFPLIAKPNVGLCGYGVQLIPSRPALHSYLASFPKDQTVMLQQYLPQEGEAGIFYVRDPHTGRGRIIGMGLRYFARVTGDGWRTLAQLVQADPRAQRAVRGSSHLSHLNRAWVPANGHMVRLATVGSLRVGSIYRNGRSCITPQLVAAIDAIARDMPDFHFGRFDVRFDSLADLRCGRGLHIMEINGAGSEAIEAWDPRIGILQGLRLVFAKQRLLFAIGHNNRKNGIRPMRLLALARLHWHQLKLIARYPPSN